MSVRDETRSEIIGTTAPAGDSSRTVAGRIASVDVLRGLTILLMIFVNDLGSAAPSWMHHIQPPRADGMTLADIVFPAFLFIVGVSIPLAFEQARCGRDDRPGPSRPHSDPHRLAVVHGRSRLQQRGRPDAPPTLVGYSGVRHPDPRLVRDTSRANDQKEGPDRRQGTWDRRVARPSRRLSSRANHRRGPVLGRLEGWVWLQTGWWGILGLIGWAYLTVAVLTMILGRRREWLIGALAILMLLHLAMQRGGLFTRLESKPWLGPALQPLKLLAKGCRIHRPVRQPGRRTGVAGGDHHGRLPVGGDPPAR